MSDPGPDYRWQQEIEQQRYEMLMDILSRVRTGMTPIEDYRVLKLDLGLEKEPDENLRTDAIQVSEEGRR